MDKEYIPREDVINDIGELFTICQETLPNECGHHFIVENELQTHLDFVRNLPAADVVEVVRCRECIHRPSGTGVNHDVKFPDDECPCKCPDTWYSWMPPADWYCADGKRKDGGQDDV